MYFRGGNRQVRLRVGVLGYGHTRRVHSNAGEAIQQLGEGTGEVGARTLRHDGALDSERSFRTCQKGSFSDEYNVKPDEY